MAGAALALTPLLNRLHVESMAVLAFVAFFASGSVAHRIFSGFARGENQQLQSRTGEIIRIVLIYRLLWLLLPAAMLTVAMLWAPNCDYLRGLLFLFLFPGITVVLAVSLSFILVAFRYPFWPAAVIGFVVSVVGPLYDIGLHPQFYTYNHVFGGVLGPIYDEGLELRFGLFVFRFLTLLWAVLLVCIGSSRMLLGSAWRRRTRIAMLVVSLSIGSGYLFSAQLGINTPEWYLKSKFSGHKPTEHFDLYYDSSSVTDRMVDLWAIEHEYRYSVLSEYLKIDVSERIQSFIYPDATRRAFYTGARVTSVAPVWLNTAQVHVLADQIETVFPHELVHVFSREIGLPVVRASLVVGLVEGLAVALEPPDGGPTPQEKVAASRLFNLLDTELLADQMAATLSPSGFWGGRGGVSYETSGAFVRWLMDRGGIELFKKVYARGNFKAVYGKSVHRLSQEWSSSLASISSINRSAFVSAVRLFSIPSLFERDCPHWTPPGAHAYRLAVEAVAEGEIEEAYRIWNSLLDDPVAGKFAGTGLRKIRLSNGETNFLLDVYKDEAVDSLSRAENLISADVLALSGESRLAADAYHRLRNVYPILAQDSRAALEMRSVGAIYPTIVKAVTQLGPDSVRIAFLDSLLLFQEKSSNRNGRGGFDPPSMQGNTDLPSPSAQQGVSSSGMPRDRVTFPKRFSLVVAYWRSRLLFANEEFTRAAEDAALVIDQISDLNLIGTGYMNSSAVDANRRDLEFVHISAETVGMLFLQAARYSFAAGIFDAALQYSQRSVDQARRTGNFAMYRLAEDFRKKVKWTLTWPEKTRIQQ